MVTVDVCDCEWARVVVVLPMADDVGRTLLDAADRLADTVLAGLGEADGEVGTGLASECSRATEGGRADVDGLDSLASLN